MDHAAFHIVYVDKRVTPTLNGAYLHGDAHDLPVEKDLVLRRDRQVDRSQQISSEIQVVRDNLEKLLWGFRGVHICTSGSSCMARLVELDSNEANRQPTLVILEGTMALASMQAGDHVSDSYSQSNSSLHSHSVPSVLSAEAALQDSSLLRNITSHIAKSKAPSLIVPLAFIELSEDAHYAAGGQAPDQYRPLVPPEMLKCMDDGAADVFFSPLARDSICSIACHAYRVQKDKWRQRTSFQEGKKARKRSWVGIDDRKPYAYLREEMVSGLMTRICSPEEMQPLVTHRYASQNDEAVLVLQDPSPMHADLEDNPTLIRAFTSWNFAAHDFSEDQLVHAALLMLQHALNMPELERWRIPAADLQSFLLASRAAYNSFVHYHNFRHVVDVMQAIFYFLLCIGTLPPYPQQTASSSMPAAPKSPIGHLLQPFDALTLLVSAIGHDVGHPGVNNAFLVALNAPLAQLYNDKSVLESFHCAAYSQILRRYWKSTFADTAMRGLMISSILATDMGLHFKYMADLGELQEKIYQNQGTQGWSPQVLDEYRTLTCGLLIKCADISNVARPFDVAATWADILQLEFANQGAMENDLGMSTALFGGPPELGNVTKLANSQIGFMNIFACPLFEAVSDILPCMTFAVDEMRANQETWRKKIAEQTPKQPKKSFSSESFLSPRSGSPSRSSSQPESSHPEGFPASQTSAQILTQSDSASIPGSEEPRRNPAAAVVRPPPDPMTQAHPDGSRRLSAGAPSGNAQAFVDPNASSRRSSSGFLTGHGMPQPLVTLRSSNTSPSQLQLALGTDAASQASPTISARENVQPGRQSSEGTASYTNVSTLTSDTGSRNITLFGGGGSAARKGSKSSDGDQTYSQQRSLAHSMARHSPYSTHERHSSGGHTSRSQSVPYSPTETQATSVTEDSDDKSPYLHERGGSSTIPEGIPEAFDAEKPGSGHRLPASGIMNHAKTPDVKTSVLNGGGGTHHSHSGGLASKKSSRFLSFWKKRGKVTEPGS
ncbi:MAG: hypothetical protein LQ345_000584 [Seirophora villosa]|nr:MAG: hypothetical protein LQ345_000584 [Seirophora villosa]